MKVASPRDAYGFPPDCARRFRAEEHLASGGHGAVFLATQLDLERRVVIKLLLDVVVEPEARRRFDNEARIAASLQHPHLVRVLDHGSATVPWIAYELVDGGSLRQRLALGRLSAREVALIGAQMCHALEAAHAVGVLHRDVKPDNILQASPELWKLTDFGIARWDQASAIPTQRGLVLGTPSYLAPEAIRGEAPDGRQDLYALGATLYELLTGHAPIEDENVFRVLERQLTELPPAPSALVPDVPPELEAIILRSLAKDRSDRYADAVAMGLALERAARTPGDAPRRSPAAAPRAAANVGNALASPQKVIKTTVSPTAAATPPAHTSRAPRTARTYAVPALAALSLAGVLVFAFLPRRPPQTLPQTPPAANTTGEMTLLFSPYQGKQDLSDATLQELLARIASPPELTERVLVDPQLAWRLQTVLWKESEVSCQAFENLTAELREADTSQEAFRAVNRESVARFRVRRSYAAALRASRSPEFENLSRMFAARRPVLAARLRALLSMDLTFPSAAFACSDLAWELPLSQIMLPDAPDPLAVLHDAEKGRPDSWMNDYLRAELAGAAGDSTRACGLFAHALQRVLPEERLGDPKLASQAVDTLFTALKSAAPDRGPAFDRAIDAAGRLIDRLSVSQPISESTRAQLKAARARLAVATH